MQTLAAPQQPDLRHTVAPEEFFSRVCSVNPFTDNRVTGAFDADIDVPGIHEVAHQQLLALAQEAHGGRRGLGAVLLGEAGIGKSHALARLARWAGPGDRACFVPLHNLQANPENLPRSVLRTVVSHLTLGQARQFTQTPLFRLVLGFVSEALGHDRTVTHPWPKAERAYAALLDRIGAAGAARAACVDRRVYEVLFQFFRSVVRMSVGRDDGIAPLAIRWLAGDGLDVEQAEALGFRRGRPESEPVALVDNQDIKQVLAALTRMAWSRGQAFVLGFDQVDNLDPEQVSALARFLEALLDGVGNLLVVTAGVKASLLEFRTSRVIQDSAWDRVAQFEISLQRISAAEGRRIVAARLEHFLGPFVDLPEVRQHVRADPLFPLGAQWAAEFLDGKIEVRPRDVLSAAREGWRREQDRLRQRGGPAWLAAWGTREETAHGSNGSTPTPWQPETALDQKVEAKLREQQEFRARHPAGLPPDADNLAGLTAAILHQWQQASAAGPILEVQYPAAPQVGGSAPYNLVVTHRRADAAEAVRTGLRFLSTTNAWSVTAALRWLIQDRSPPQRVLLVADARLPLVFGKQPDAQGRTFYRQLCQLGPDRFRYIELSFADYAYLDALQAVAGMARSGELELEEPGGQLRAVSELEVAASHARRGRYRAAPLLQALVAAGAEAV